MATPRKLRCTVSQIIRHGAEGDRVYTIRLKPERPLPQFQAGQFLHLAIDPYDPSSFWPDSRAFSIASAPAEREELEIVYSVVGRFTTRMEQELKPGREVWVKLPYGEFVVQAGAGTEVVLLAGGTGITAFTAFLKAYAERRAEDGSAVKVFYGVRNARLLLFGQTLRDCASVNPAIDARCLVEEIDGRLSVQQAWDSLRSPTKAVFYLSGPPVMIKAFSDDLAARGLPREQIRVDAWE
jgi:ferredoxin-NADP reductase